MGTSSLRMYLSGQAKLKTESRYVACCWSQWWMIEDWFDLLKSCKHQLSHYWQSDVWSSILSLSTHRVIRILNFVRRPVVVSRTICLICLHRQKELFLTLYLGLRRYRVSVTLICTTWSLWEKAFMFDMLPTEGFEEGT